jgi:hypothetical protein
LEFADDAATNQHAARDLAGLSIAKTSKRARQKTAKDEVVKFAAVIQ